MINHDPDITRLLDRLEGRKLIQRSRGQKDRRVINARITLAGLDLLKSMNREVADTHRKLLGHLGEQRLHLLFRLLEEAGQKSRVSQAPTGAEVPDRFGTLRELNRTLPRRCRRFAVFQQRGRPC
jgi:hypothetical protein